MADAVVQYNQSLTFLAHAKIVVEEFPQAIIQAYVPRSGVAYGDFQMSDDVFYRGEGFNLDDVVDARATLAAERS